MTMQTMLNVPLAFERKLRRKSEGPENMRRDKGIMTYYFVP